MNISNVLNPSAALGQVSVWLVAILIGFIGGGYAHYKFMTSDCPPTTSIHVDPKIKGVKKGSNVNLGISAIIGSDSCQYDNYIRSLSMKEIRKIKKDN